MIGLPTIRRNLYLKEKTFFGNITAHCAAPGHHCVFSCCDARFDASFFGGQRSCTLRRLWVAIEVGANS